jgi:hypothetical protein
LPPAEGLCGNLSDIHPVCALGRRQTNAMTIKNGILLHAFNKK